MDAKPDALMIPATLKIGRRMSARVQSIRALADPILEVDRANGETAYIRSQKDKIFVAKGVDETILFPTWHDLEGQPRYNWKLQDSGIEYGYLVEGATRGGEPRDA